MKKKLKNWLRYQEKRYAYRLKMFTKIQHPEYKVWLIDEIKSSIKSVGSYHQEAMREIMKGIKDDILWSEMLKKYLKELKKQNDPKESL